MSDIVLVKTPNGALAPADEEARALIEKLKAGQGVRATVRKALAQRQVCGYTATVTSKKGVIGIGVPMHRCDESRSFSSAEYAASLSVPPVMAARMGGRKARRFPQGLPGTPAHLSCRLRLASRAAVVANRSPWRPIMALSSSGAPAPASYAATTAIRLNAEYLDTVLAALAHADAMVNMTCGNSGEAFRCMSQGGRFDFF